MQVIQLHLIYISLKNMAFHKLDTELLLLESEMILMLTFHVPSTEPYKDIDNSCRKAIEEPPIPQDALNNERTRQSDVVVRRLQHILPGQNAFTADLPEELQLNIKGAKISQIYKRLDPTKPSYTVTGSGGGWNPYLSLGRTKSID